MNNKLINKILIVSTVLLMSFILLSFKSTTFSNSSEIEKQMIEYNNKISNVQLTALASNINRYFKYDRKVSIFKVFNNQNIRTNLTMQNKFINIIMGEDVKDLNLLPYFKDEYYERYEKYFKKNPNLTYDEIVTFVNIGLDNDFYSNINIINETNKQCVVVNKYNRLSSDFVPQNLVAIDSKFSNGNQMLTVEAKTMFEKLAKQASIDGYELKAISTYRSFKDQYNNYYSKINGGRSQKDVDRYNARPGHSEHELGLAVDVNSLSPLHFSKSNQFYEVYEWYKNCAHEYGFIIRYPKNKEHITGYSYEPWHLRYVGIEIATYLYESKITLDEYVARNFS